MTWEIVCACGWDEARKLAADGYEPYAVDHDGHYFKRLVDCPEHIDIEAIRNTGAYNAIRANTLKEVGAWLRQQVGNVWTLEQFHAFQRGELPK